jgi:tocopherol cyclase
MILGSIRKSWIPAIYHGKKNMRGYFEGWYYKFADKDGNNIGAIIPGVSLDKEGNNSHAFIQFIDGSGVLSRYFRYALSDFSDSDNGPSIRIGHNYFSPELVQVNISEPQTIIRGTLEFKDITPWPVRFLSPGAMGWYAFVPAMECYHGVLSFDHLIEGGLEFNGRYIDFRGGRGYIEKDWGRSFPKYHIWLQTNHFKEPGISLMLSIANVPWLRSSFNGFIIGFWFRDHLLSFTTYNGSRITAFQYKQQQLLLAVRSRRYRLELQVSYLKGAELLTPVLGEMRGRLSESLSASTQLKLFRRGHKSEELIYQGTGAHTGLEIEGELPSRLFNTI